MREVKRGMEVMRVIEVNREMGGGGEEGER